MWLEDYQVANSAFFKELDEREKVSHFRTEIERRFKNANDLTEELRTKDLQEKKAMKNQHRELNVEVQVFKNQYKKMIQETQGLETV